MIDSWLLLVSTRVERVPPMFLVHAFKRGYVDHDHVLLTLLVDTRDRDLDCSAWVHMGGEGLTGDSPGIYIALA